MIDHVWTVLCSRSVTDKDTNNINLLEVIEQVTIIGTPPPEGQEGIVPIPLEVVTLWTRTRDDQSARGRARIKFVRPSGVLDRATNEIDVDLTTHKRTRNSMKISGLPISEQGRHGFTVELWKDETQTWAEVASIPLEVGFSPQT